MAVCFSRTILAGIGILNSFQLAKGLAGTADEKEDRPIKEGPNFEAVKKIAQSVGLTKPISLFSSERVREIISAGSNLPFGEAQIFLPRETAQNRYSSQDMRNYFIARQVLAIKAGASFLPQLIGIITSIAVFILLTPYAPLAASFIAFFVHSGTLFFTLRHISQKVNQEAMSHCSDLSLKAAKTFWLGMDRIFNHRLAWQSLDFKDRQNFSLSWMLNGSFAQRAKEIDDYLKKHPVAVNVSEQAPA